MGLFDVAAADRWYNIEGLCSDLDSVRIIDGPGATPRLVAFKMGWCSNSYSVEWWSIDLADCEDARAGADGIVLYRYTPDGTWNLMSVHDHEDRELRHAAVACNWANPHFR